LSTPFIFSLRLEALRRVLTILAGGTVTFPALSLQVRRHILVMEDYWIGACSIFADTEPNAPRYRPPPYTFYPVYFPR